MTNDGITSGCCGGSCGTGASPATTERPAKTFQPLVDVVDAGGEIVARLDVPGASAETIHVNLEKGVLTVRADVRARAREGGRWARREYGVGPYERRFRVGESIDPSGISAEYADGVLTVRLPKRAEGGARRVAVTARN